MLPSDYVRARYAELAASDPCPYRARHAARAHGTYRVYAIWTDHGYVSLGAAHRPYEMLIAVVGELTGETWRGRPLARLVREGEGEESIWRGHGLRVRAWFDSDDDGRLVVQSVEREWQEIAVLDGPIGGRMTLTNGHFTHELPHHADAARYTLAIADLLNPHPPPPIL